LLAQDVSSITPMMAICQGGVTAMCAEMLECKKQRPAYSKGSE
jgi:hypothetical protein